MECILIRKNFVDANFIDSKVMMNLQNLYCMVPFFEGYIFCKKKVLGNNFHESAFLFSLPSVS